MLHGRELLQFLCAAHISRKTPPYCLEHLALEYNCQSEETLTALIAPHVARLKRLVMLNSWIRPNGTWQGWLRGMKDAGLYLDYLGLWKPCQADTELFRDQERWFELGSVSAVSKKGKVVPFLPQETWDNCFPRLGRR
jgi:hypothetical protein